MQHRSNSLGQTYTQMLVSSKHLLSTSISFFDTSPPIPIFCNFLSQLVTPSLLRPLVTLQNWVSPPPPRLLCCGCRHSVSPTAALNDDASLKSRHETCRMYWAVLDLGYVVVQDMSAFAQNPGPPHFCQLHSCLILISNFHCYLIILGLHTVIKYCVIQGIFKVQILLLFVSNYIVKIEHFKHAVW